MQDYDHLRPWRAIERRKSRKIMVGQVPVGGDAPIAVQSMTNTLTYEHWKPSGMPATWEYDHGSGAPCDYCAIASHTMGTSGNTLAVEYHDGSDWVELLSQAVTTNEPIFCIFSYTDAQRWRLSISGGTPPEIGVVKFGVAFQMPRPVFGGVTPSYFARNTVLRHNRSETGASLGNVAQRSARTAEITWSNLPQVFMRDNWNAVQKAIEAEAFFLAWRPGSNGDCLFGELSGEVPKPSNMGVRDLMAVSLSMIGEGWD